MPSPSKGSSAENFEPDTFDFALFGHDLSPQSTVQSSAKIDVPDHAQHSSSDASNVGEYGGAKYTR